jgi:predicted ester cyclase
MCLTPLGGIMHGAGPLEKRELARRTFYVGGREYGFGPPFLGGARQGDLDAMEQMMAPDFVDHTLAPGQESDREGYKRQVAGYAAAFSDLTYTIEDQVAGGDKIVTRFIVRGTHDRREFMGVAPTGREVTNIAIAIHRISEGKIAEEWGVGTSISELRKGIVARRQLSFS